MKLSALLPGSLARRFAFGAAGLAAAALLVTTLASWWMIEHQHDDALTVLAAKEREFHAAAVGSQLHALAGRISEVAVSTIIATGLVDSAGRETYLVPFLSGLRQVNGVPVQLLFTDFEGNEIASNGPAAFTASQLEWLREELKAERASAAIFRTGAGDELVALHPLVYARTRSPEGALLYKVAVHDLHQGAGMRIEWGRQDGAPDGSVTQIPVPAVFEALEFRVRGDDVTVPGSASLAPQYATMFLLALVFFSVVVLAGLALARVLTRDLAALEAFSRRFISTGLSSERAPLAGSAEVASLAMSINGMLDRLHEQHSALLREGDKLAALAAALKDADRRKDEFLAMLAHELRNPLAPIKSTAMVLKARPVADPQLAWARDVLDRQVDQMARLLDDLLDVSRITRNKLELRRERMALGPVVEAAVETSQPVIQAAGHELIIDLPAKPVYLDADPLRLAQVLANLLNNAAKYTDRAGHIRLAAGCDGDQVIIRVSDDGAGIAPEQLQHIFGMFMRPESAARHAPGGLGIGLYLVRSLVEMHGGTVNAHSEGLGKGSEFVVRLPCAAARRDEPPAKAHDGQRSATRRPGRVLVVDDNVDAADSLAMLLKLQGHEVSVAYDAGSALAQAEAMPPEVAFLDLGMPEVDGYALARQLRSHPSLKDACLIALTGWGQPDDREKTKAAGFDEHVVKPVDAEALHGLLTMRGGRVGETAPRPR